MFIDPFYDKKKLLNAIDIKAYRDGDTTRVTMSLQAGEDEEKKHMSATVSVTDDAGSSEEMLNYMIGRLKKELVESYLNEFITSADVRSFIFGMITEWYRAHEEKESK